MARFFHMSRRARAGGGFTLLELIVVVAIIGILAVIAIPLCAELLKKSKTCEAKACLGEIRILEEGYRVGFLTYIGCPPMQEIQAGLHNENSPDIDNMSLIGFYPTGITRYTYRIESADSTSFTASGEGSLDGDGDRDRWEISETGILLHTQVD